MEQEFPYVRVREIHEDSPFYISRLTRASLYHTPDGQELRIHLDRREFMDAGPLDSHNHSQIPWIISLRTGNNPSANGLENTLKRFSDGANVRIATDRSPVRWLGSGGILLLKDKAGIYAVINKRVGSSLWEGKFDANGGLSSSIEEMVKPGMLAKRELGEEIIVNGAPVNEFNLTELKPENACRVKIYLKPSTFCEDGLILVIDPKTGTIDFRKIYLTEVRDVAKINIADTETVHSRDHLSLPTNRPIFIFPLMPLLGVLDYGVSLFPLSGFRGGAKMQGQELVNYPISREYITPALRAILKSLKYDVNFQKLD